ncbi:MAG: ABC transporter permease subunit [Planctomycetota bacterium]|nr:ABC transporter permease subunit [Planctomycetota bacterium]
MTLLRRTWRLLDDVQRRPIAQVVLTIVALLLVGATFGRAYVAAMDARGKFDQVVEVLREANSIEQDAVAMRLLESGEVEAGGRVYGGPRIQASIANYFEETSGDLLQIAEISALLVSETIPDWLPAAVIDRPEFLLWAALVVTAWFAVVIWTGVTLPAVLAAGGTMLLAWPAYARGYPGLGISILGVGVLVTTFLILIRSLVLLLGLIASPGTMPSRHGRPGRIVQVAAVAQTVVRESTRLRITLAFIVVMLIALPLIPLWIDPTEPVRYQVQNFLSDSMSLVYGLAAVMTLVLACATVSFEIRDRQIWHLVTKPLGRAQYLLGKWVGICLLNLVLLVIGGISIFGFTEYLGTRANDPQAVVEVHDEILTARVGIRPTYDQLSSNDVRELAYEEYQNDKITRDKVEAGEADEFDVIRGIVQRLRREHLDRQRAVPPGGFNENREYDARVYTFEGLGAAARSGRNLTLRYRTHIGRSESTDRYPVVFRFPEFGDEIQRDLIPEQWQSVLLPTELIGEDGTLKIQILNGGFSESPSSATRMFFANGATLMFDADEFEIMWQASSFESNFARAMIVNWVKLSFLAMLGVVASTFLSFPVAMLLAFTVFAGGSMTPFISTSLQQFRIDQDAFILIKLAQYVIAAIARAAEWLLRPFGEASPNRLVVEGRLVSTAAVVRDVAILGVFWCGSVLLVGWAVLRRRELATYSGHG